MIAKYRSQTAAKRYAKDLARVHPSRAFDVVPHPSDFGYTVACVKDGKPIAYVMRRNRVFAAMLRKDTPCMPSK